MTNSTNLNEPVDQIFNRVFDKALDTPELTTAIDQWVRENLKISPDQDVTENNSYWNCYTLMIYHLGSKWSSAQYNPTYK